MGGGLGAGGGGLYLLGSAINSVWEQPAPPPPAPGEELSPHMSSWASDHWAYRAPPGASQAERARLVDEDCAAFNGTLYDPVGCSQISVGRLGGAAVRRAEERAVACGAAMGTDCVLGPEVGLMIPAAFVYEHGEGMRALLAPRLLEPRPGHSSVRRVRLLNPRTEKGLEGPAVRFNSSVNVEYMLVLGSGTRLETATLNDSAAYCVQLLRHSFPPECWVALD